MGWRFRKSVRIGPFRATVTKKGVSYSAGIPGLRFTRRADGRVQMTETLPGLGLSKTSMLSNPKGRKPAPGSQRSGDRRLALFVLLIAAAFVLAYHFV